MKRRTLVCLTFLTLFLFSALSLTTPTLSSTLPARGEKGTENSGTSISTVQSMPPVPEGPIWSGTEYSYAGLGQVLTTQEFSAGTTGTLSVSDLDFGETSSGQITLPQEWTGYELSANVFNLFDNISHIEGNIRNGNFESGTTTPTYWVQSQRGMSGSGLLGLHWFYGPAWGETGDGVAVLANCSGYNWISNETYTEYVGWTQTIDLNRIDATSATLSLRVQFYDDNVHGRDDDDEMAVYVEVGGAKRLFVCHRYALNAYRGGWGFHDIVYSLSVDELNDWTSDTIDVTIGMSVDFDWNINNYFYMEFDDVKLVVRGQPSPTSNAIQLRLNSTSSWTDTDYGSGTITLTGVWGPYAADHNIVAVWSTAASRSRDVDFNYTLTMKIKRSGQTEAQTGPEGSAFNVRHGQNVTWTSWFFADFYSIYYQNYNFTVKKPGSDIWDLTSVIDPNLNDKTAEVLAASNSTYWRLPISLINAFGWWKFTFNSTNQISSVSGLQSIYRISPRSPSGLSVTVTFGSVTSGNVNLTMYDANHQEVDSVTETVSGATKILTYTFTDGDLFPAGTYDLCISYDNNPTGSHAGFYHDTFDIEHDSSLTPETTPLSVAYSEGEYFYPRVSYNDLDTTGNPFIANTTETTIVTGQVSGYPLVTFRQVGSLYQAIVPDNYISPGDHDFVVTANDPLYDSAQTTIILQVRSETTLSSLTPGYTAYYQETFTLQVFFEDNIGTPISGAASWFSTPGWSGTIITAGGSAGWYNIQVDSDADGRIPGTHTLTVNVVDSLDYYQSQTLEFTITVRGRNTLLTSTTPSSVPNGISANFSITLSDLDGGSPPDNSTGRLHLSVWLGATKWVDPDATISYSGSPGVWDISIDTSTLSIGEHAFIVNFSWYHISSHNSPYYGNRTVGVTVSVRETGTTITYTPPNPEPWGNDIIIVIKYEIDDPPLGGGIAGIVKAYVSCDLDGSPYGGFGWNPIGGGSYQLTIYAADISLVHVFWLDIVINDPTDRYQEASRTISFSIIEHQTQTVVNQPDPTAFGDPTNSIVVDWSDLNGTVLDDSFLSSMEIRNATDDALITTVFSLTFDLDTSSWLPGTYDLRVTTIPTGTKYLESTGSLRIIIIIHRTAVTILPPEPTPWGEDTTITIQWIDLTKGGYIDATEAAQIIVTGAVSRIINNPTSWTFDLPTSGLTIGGSPYSINVQVIAKTTPQIYSNSNSSFNQLTIRGHRVYVRITGPAPVPEDGSFLISVNWTDLDTGTPISLTFLQEVRVENIGALSTPTLPWSNDSSLEFYIDATGWDRGTHRLNVTVFANDPRFETGYASVNIVIRVHSITADVDSIPRVPVGHNVTIILRVDDSDDGTPLPQDAISSIVITGGFSGITLDSSNWMDLVTNGTYGAGTYLITLDIDGWPLNTYALTFSITPIAEFGPGSVNTGLIIRSLSTGFIYQATVATAFGEDAEFNVSYFVSDISAYTQDGNGISGGTITISGLTPGVHFTVYDHGDGNYTITLFASIFGGSGEYFYNIAISSGATWDDNSLSNVKVTIRNLLMWLHAIDVPQVPFGDNANITVVYEVQDPDSGINTDWINGATIRVNVSAGLIYGVDYIVTDNGDGSYLITIYAAIVNQIQWYTIVVETIATPAGYSSRTIPVLNFQVRTVGATLVVLPPDPEPYEDNFTISVTYEISDIDTPRNGDPILGYPDIIQLLGYTWGVDYRVEEVGGGLYLIYLNSSILGKPSSYQLTVITGWAPPPPFASQTKQITVTVITRATSTVKTPTSTYGYADNITLDFTYQDTTRSNNWITNSSYGGTLIRLTLEWKSVTQGVPNFITIGRSYWYITALTPGVDSHAFRLEVEARFYGVVDTFYDFRLNITWLYDNAPYFENQSVEFRAYVLGQPTNVIPRLPEGSIPYGSNITFSILYQTEGGNPITNSTPNANVSITLWCPEVSSFGNYGVDWWIVNYYNGTYTIIIDSTALPEITFYLFYLNVTYLDKSTGKTPEPFYQSHYKEPIPLEIRAINTILTMEKQSEVFYWGQDITINITYWDIDNNKGMDLPTINITTIGQIVGYSSVLLSPGIWRIVFETSEFSAGEFVKFEITCNKTYYITRQINSQIFLDPLPLNVEIESITTSTQTQTSTLVEEFYGYGILVQLNVTDIWGGTITDADIDFMWLGPFSSFTHIGGGVYQGTLDATYTTGRYGVEIRAYKGLTGAYDNESLYLTLIILPGPSQLDPVTSGPLQGIGTYQVKYVSTGGTFTVRVHYTTAAGGNITGADVTYLLVGAIGINGTMTPLSGYPGYYTVTLLIPSTPKIYSIQITAIFPNVAQGALSYTLDVRFTPAELIVTNTSMDVMYGETFLLLLRMRETISPYNYVGGAYIRALWAGFNSSTDVWLDYGAINGSQYYYYFFIANRTSGRWSITFDWLPIGEAYQVDPISVTITIMERATAIPVIDSVLSFYQESNRSVSIIEMAVPIGDILYIYLNWTAPDGSPVLGGGGGATIGYLSEPIIFDEILGLYVLEVNCTKYGLGLHNFRIQLTAENYETNYLSAAFTVTEIPMELTIIEFTGVITNPDGSRLTYIGEEFQLRILVNDTWHGNPVEGVTLFIPEALASYDELGDGYYLITGIKNTLGDITINFEVTATKEEPFPHATIVPISFSFTIVQHPTFTLITIGGSIGAVILIFALMGWLLWSRVYSIPWEVRRMRKLAKTVEKEEGFTLTKKDQKHFHDRGVVIEEKVDTAMTTIGVAMTPAMIPTIAEVEEVTATEEDIMAELSKIPGLGAEEKAVLAEEMRKIPRKDRIWFLDDLRRQMGQRRMDFLTQRERPAETEPTPEVDEPIPPEETPTEPKTPALEEVKPKEPPPSKALTEDRTAPTVLPPDLQPIPSAPAKVIAEIRRELSKIPGLSDVEKDALVDHLQYLSKEERQATYRSLRMSANSDE